MLTGLPGEWLLPGNYFADLPGDVVNRANETSADSSGLWIVTGGRRWPKVSHNSSETWLFDQTGCNTNPKGEIDNGEHDRHTFAKSNFWHESTIIILKDIWTDPTGCNTNPKGGNRLWRTIFAWFHKNDFSQEVTSIIRPKPYESIKRALIRTRRGEIDYGEQYSHGFAKSMFWK